MTASPASAGSVPASGLSAWLRRPVVVACAAVITLTLVGWAALMIEAARSGWSGAAVTGALCRPAAITSAASAGDVAAAFAANMALWGAMALGMMTPTATPMMLAYAEKAQAATKAGYRPASPIVVIAGYAGLWIAVAAVAALAQFALSRAVSRLGLPDSALAVLAGTAIGAAGLYQFSEAKAVCLALCRHPFPVLQDEDIQSRAAMLRLGLAQGAACFGCCAGMMAVMLVAGVMNLFWMAALSLLMTIERLTGGTAAPRLIGLGLVAAGLAVAFGAVGLDSVVRWLTTA